MQKRAVVLAGGGARGPYQVGVWQALRKLGVDYQIVTGTSVGALNGALMVQDDFSVAKELWEQITEKDVVSLPELPPEGTLPEKGRALKGFFRQVVELGGLDVSPLEEHLRLAIDEERFRASPVEFGLITTRYPLIKQLQLRKADIPQGKLVDYLLASAAYFPFFQSKEIEGVRYVDGALTDNMPVELAIACGAEELVAVDLHAVGVVHSYKSEVPVTYIDSYWDLGQTLAFDPEKARHNMRLGYLDGLRAYHRLEGRAYAFYRGETRRNAAFLHNALQSVCRDLGMDLSTQLRKLTPGLQVRHSRFLKPGEEDITFGRAVTTAAEITGERLEMEPGEIYRFHDFNHTLLGLWRERVAAKRLGELRTVQILYRQLEKAVEGKAMGEVFWGLTSLAPRDLVTATYLLALERRYSG